MKDGFVKAAAATPDIRVADVAYNTENICKMIDETVANGAKVIVFPELCVTGYTCSDLFMQDILLKEAKEALFKIADYTKEKDALIFIGVPLAVDGEIFWDLRQRHFFRIMGNFMRCVNSVRDRIRQGGLH